MNTSTDEQSQQATLWFGCWCLLANWISLHKASDSAFFGEFVAENSPGVRSPVVLGINPGLSSVAEPGVQVSYLRKCDWRSEVNHRRLKRASGNRTFCVACATNSRKSTAVGVFRVPPGYGRTSGRSRMAFGCREMAA